MKIKYQKVEVAGKEVILFPFQYRCSIYTYQILGFANQLFEKCDRIHNTQMDCWNEARRKIDILIGKDHG